ncbi:MAG: SGNH/GDSL hydrolase family protein [Deltaproteobacteria bacterium]|nr:SGNH/GDSL hydrolase family protein [Deltaproteobacteria bacterium]
MTRTKRIVANLGVALLGIVTALVIVEVAFRLVAGRKARPWDDRPSLYFMPAGARSLGDGPYPFEKPAEVFRVAVIGDSFTFGPNMQFEDTFPKRMERWLNLEHKGKAEVINFGVSGLSTYNEAAVLSMAFDYSPDLVLLEITLNDAELNPLTREERDKLFGAPFLKYKLFTYWKSAAYLLSRLHNTQTRRLYINYFENLFDDPSMYGRFMKSLRKVGAACRSRNVKVAAIIFPLFDFPFDKNYPFQRVHKRIHDALKQAEIPFIDLRRIYDGIPPERLQVIPGFDSHPNEIAHRMAAESVIKWLATEALLPEKVLPMHVYRSREASKAPHLVKGIRAADKRLRRAMMEH